MNVYVVVEWTGPDKAAPIGVYSSLETAKDSQQCNWSAVRLEDSSAILESTAGRELYIYEFDCR